MSCLIIQVSPLTPCYGRCRHLFYPQRISPCAGTYTHHRSLVLDWRRWLSEAETSNDNAIEEDNFQILTKIYRFLLQARAQAYVAAAQALLDLPRVEAINRPCIEVGC